MIRTTTFVSLTLGAALATPPAACAQAEAVPDTTQQVDDLIEWLDAPLFVARQQALAALLERRDLTLAEVEMWRSRADLSLSLIHI